ncbi:hypothetical protein DNU06_01390 [Putridiphycobacter roseus]|uniref:Glycosyl transferase family 28 C-terminal domain-containing protein n=1 Tax=Putridiphycobacter roseus TaxID=2219161 RepID=A0A2W1N3U5_9FLAO|nr:hypothetical protein [Putridiphycobacter roseus]PZE18514.1 hypothetical protein DNU06_01390 [Putridiphycobacter roseus]
MFQPNDIKNATVLIAPLDWGSGHTTRTFALIKKLILQKNKIIFAGNQSQIDFIKKEGLAIETVELEGYQFNFNPNYSLYLQVSKQLLKLKNAIKIEKKWLANYLKEHVIDFIISDNRYGFYHNSVKSIFLTHQTNLDISFGKNMVNKILKNKIEKFDVCWIPDYQDQRLSGKLSNHKLTIPTYFIGPLSRFKPTLKPQHDFVYKYLFIVSGPSPHKEQLLDKIIQFTSTSNYDIGIVTNILQPKKTPTKNTILFINPTTSELQQLIVNSETIICKCGYTSLMELSTLQKNTFYIPSQNQQEQAYLRKLHQKLTPKNLQTIALFFKA